MQLASSSKKQKASSYISGKCELSTISIYGVEKGDKMSNLVHVKQLNPGDGLEVVKEEDDWSLNFWHKGQEGGRNTLAIPRYSNCCDILKSR